MPVDVYIPVSGQCHFHSKVFINDQMVGGDLKVRFSGEPLEVYNELWKDKLSTVTINLKKPKGKQNQTGASDATSRTGSETNHSVPVR